METYRVNFLDHGKNVRDTERFDAADDAAAINYARERFWTGIGWGREIWRNETLIHTEKYR